MVSIVHLRSASTQSVTVSISRLVKLLGYSSRAASLAEFFRSGMAHKVEEGPFSHLPRTLCFPSLCGAKVGQGHQVGPHHVEQPATPAARRWSHDC